LHFHAAIGYIFLFFFSSRRRHTRFSRDWSSDVCSSDLALSFVRELSAFTWAWGQFIDHDITLTKDKADELLPIAVPVGDLFFDQIGRASCRERVSIPTAAAAF